MNRFFDSLKRIGTNLRVRYGINSTTIILLIAAIVCSTLARYTGFAVLSILTFALLALAIVTTRGMKLKDVPAKLGVLFSRFGGKVKRNAAAGKSRRADTQHKYYHCPQCSKMLRVPKGKGKIEIRCTCGRTFVRKT